MPDAPAALVASGVPDASHVPVSSDVPGAREGGAAGGRSTLRLWLAARVVPAAAAALAIALRPPDDASLVAARAFGAQIAAAGRVPLRLGPEIFGAPGAWDGGLGWLGALGVWFAGLAGPAGALVAACAAAFAALALVEFRAARRAPASFAFGAAVLAALCCGDALRAGGGLENAAFAAGLYLLLERPGPRAAAAATLLAVLWCNVSAQGILAPALAALAALGFSLELRPAAERRWGWFACAGAGLATLVTPAGLSFPGLAFEALRIDRALEGLVAYHPADVSALAYRTGFTLAVLTALAFGAGRLRAGDALLWTGALLAALANGALLPIFGVLAAPLLAASAAERFGYGEGGVRTPWAARLALGAAAVVLAAVAGAVGLARPAAPAEAAILARTLAADRRVHRLYCANVDWCGVAVAAGAPGVRAYMDGRVEAYPAAVRDEERAISRLKGDWRGQLAAAGVDAVLVRRDRAFATLTAARPGWRLAGTTDTLALYVRRP